MENTLPNDEITQKATDDLVEFALMAFASEYLIWDASTNVTLAAIAWNAGHRATPPPRKPLSLPDPRMHRLFETLIEARRSRWGDQDFLVEELTCRIEDDSIVFYSVLTWDDGHTFRPCRTEVRTYLPGESLGASPHH